MRKHLLAVCIGLAWMLWGCDDDEPIVDQIGTDIKVTFDDVCKATGGSINNGLCVCSGVSCQSGKVCDAQTKQCAVSSVIQGEVTFADICSATGGTMNNGRCVCSGESCGNGQVCDTQTKQCAAAQIIKTEVTFADICEATGGSLNDGLCVCSGISCQSGQVCDAQTKQCAASSVVKTEVTFADICEATGGSVVDGHCTCSGVACQDGQVCDSVTKQCAERKVVEPEVTFDMMCMKSGGEVSEEGACVCDSTTCDSGIICNFGTKKCANTIETLQKCELGTPTVCEEDGEGVGLVKECFGGYLFERKCNNVGCTSKGDDCAATFDELCEGTGGTVSDDGACICNGKTCPDGIICVADGEHTKCASEVTICECVNGDVKCRNRDDGIGEIYRCVDCKWVRDKETDKDGNIVLDENGNEKEKTCAGSCNRSLTGCGEDNCVDYTVECKNGLVGDRESGAIAQCQFGKWQVQSACSDGVSCNVETGNCGECKNGTTKCENHEISNIVNKNCDYKGNCEKDSNGNTKYYPGTVGVQLLCYDGRWSDYNDLTRSSYCPSVSHTFQKYDGYKGFQDWSTEMTHVHRNGSAYYDDYHYSSCHNTGSVSECGTCHNDFMACNDEKENKPLGRLQKCDNGVLTYGNYCGNKTQICKDQYQCPK